MEASDPDESSARSFPRQSRRCAEIVLTANFREQQYKCGAPTEESPAFPQSGSLVSCYPWRRRLFCWWLCMEYVGRQLTDSCGAKAALSSQFSSSKDLLCLVGDNEQWIFRTIDGDTSTAHLICDSSWWVHHLH